MGDIDGWIASTQSQGIKQAGEPQVVFVCADVWVISLNYTWPQFAQRLLFTRLNFRSHPNVKVLVPASGIPKWYTDLRVEWVLKSIVSTSVLRTVLNFRLALWKWWQCLVIGVKWWKSWTGIIWQWAGLQSKIILTKERLSHQNYLSFTPNDVQGKFFKRIIKIYINL